MKARLRLINQIPGLGGLNRIALEEDGWTPDTICDVEKLPKSDNFIARWGNNYKQYRIVRESELELL